MGHEESIKSDSFIEIKQKRTTIWVKQGTKDLLDELGGRKDSYDDIIKKLVFENEQLKKIQARIPQEERNMIKVSQSQQRKTSIRLGKQLVEFSYDPLTKPIADDFRFNVNYLGSTFEMMNMKCPDNAWIHLKVIERLIQLHLDPMFKVAKRQILDLKWWQRMLANLGLPDGCYKEDIEHVLIRYSIIP